MTEIIYELYSSFLRDSIIIIAKNDNEALDKGSAILLYDKYCPFYLISKDLHIVQKCLSSASTHFRKIYVDRRFTYGGIHC